MTEKDLEELPVLLTVGQIAEILSIEKSKVYKVIYKNRFRILRIGTKEIRVLKKDFIEWINKNYLNNNIYL